MTANQFQTLANRTCLDVPDFNISPENLSIAWNAIGLAGEAGEVADLVKKGIFHQQGIDMDKIEKELGDVLWYICALCKHLKIPLEKVMETNIKKLAARFPNGYFPLRTTFREGDAA